MKSNESLRKIRRTAALTGAIAAGLVPSAMAQSGGAGYNTHPIKGNSGGVAFKHKNTLNESAQKAVAHLGAQVLRGSNTVKGANTIVNEIDISKGNTLQSTTVEIPAPNFGQYELTVVAPLSERGKPVLSRASSVTVAEPGVLLNFVRNDKTGGWGFEGHYQTADGVQDTTIEASTTPNLSEREARMTSVMFRKVMGQMATEMIDALRSKPVGPLDPAFEQPSRTAVPLD